MYLSRIQNAQCAIQLPSRTCKSGNVRNIIVLYAGCSHTVDVQHEWQHKQGDNQSSQTLNCVENHKASPWLVSPPSTFLRNKLDNWVFCKPHKTHYTTHTVLKHFTWDHMFHITSVYTYTPYSMLRFHQFETKNSLSNPATPRLHTPTIHLTCGFY